MENTNDTQSNQIQKDNSYNIDNKPVTQVVKSKAVYVKDGGSENIPKKKK